MSFTRKSRNALWLGTASVLTVVLAGCSGGGADPSDPATSEDPIRIAVIVPLSNSFTAQLYTGFKARADADGIVTKLFDPGFDPQKAYSQIEQIVASGEYDGIAMLPIDAVSAIPAVEAAEEAGVRVVSMNNPLGEVQDTVKPQVRGQAGVVMDIPSYQRGVALGEMSIEACADQDPCQIAFVAGNIVVAGEQAMIKGFEAALAKAPNTELVAYRDAGDYTPDRGQNTTANVLQAFPDLKVISGSGDQLMRGSEIAIADAGLTGDVEIIGLGASELAVEGIKGGTWYGSLASLPLTVGDAAYDVLMDAIADPELSGVGISVVEDLGVLAKITKDNVDDFTPEWEG
jgi:ribose transport system substrate-binding protein